MLAVKHMYERDDCSSPAAHLGKVLAEGYGAGPAHAILCAGSVWDANGPLHFLHLFEAKMLAERVAGGAVSATCASKRQPLLGEVRKGSDLASLRPSDHYPHPLPDLALPCQLQITKA
jgi:hypothetical protein